MSMERDFEYIARMNNLTAYEDFMKESNYIEGEGRVVHPGDIEAVEYAITIDINSIQQILELHSMVGNYLEVDWVGRFRKCPVGVYKGSVCIFSAPDPKEVPRLMKRYVKNLPNMNSWEAHIEFESIHPFRDLNGRVGRLIWLSKAYDEDYNFRLSFLHEFYYQTLNNIQRRKK